jgi:5-methyltetrahydrofolate--homocysteine methyltransferase
MEFEELIKSVINGDIEGVKKGVRRAVEKGISPIDIIQKGLAPGMKIIGDRFSRLEVYLPSLLLASEAMKAGMEILKPHILKRGLKVPRIGRVVIGSIEGDVHEIGKNIVAMMLEAAGFEVYDLGKDVSISDFIKKAEEVNTDIIGVSALMTTTMQNMSRLIKDLEDLGLREKYKIMVGGGPVLPDWAMEIGADGYGRDSAEAVKEAKKLIKVKKKR